jgi:hypothetical protein
VNEKIRGPLAMPKRLPSNGRPGTRGVAFDATGSAASLPGVLIRFSKDPARVAPIRSIHFLIQDTIIEARSEHRACSSILKLPQGESATRRSLNR